MAFPLNHLYWASLQRLNPEILLFLKWKLNILHLFSSYSIGSTGSVRNKEGLLPSWSRGWGPTLQSGDSGSIPAWGTKTPHVVEQLSTTTTKARELQSPCAATRDPSWHNEDPAHCNYDPTQPKINNKQIKKKGLLQPATDMLFYSAWI